MFKRFIDFLSKIGKKSDEELFREYYDNTLCLLQLSLYELEHRDCRDFLVSLDALYQIYIDSEEIRNTKDQYRNDINYIYKSHIKKYEKLDDDDSFKNEIEKLKNIIK